MILNLQDECDLDELLSTSNLVLIFKHSTQCPISTEAYQEFSQFIEQSASLTGGAVLVIENRELSNAIARRFAVRHESPQALLIRNGRLVWHASHWSITYDSLKDAVTAYAQSPYQRN